MMKSIAATASLLAVLFLLSALSAPSDVAAGQGTLSPQETPFGVYLPAVVNQPTPTFTPTPTPMPTATAMPTPLPDAVYTLSHRGYMDGSSYIVFAELINGRSSRVCSINVVGKFYDDYGTLVATENSYAMLGTLAPRQKAPVELRVTNPPSNLTVYTLDISWQNSCNVFAYWNVTVLSQNIRNDYGAKVFGEVRNDNQQSLKSVGVVVTFYDSSGGIKYADSGSLSGNTDLAPGQTAVYSISTFKEDLMPWPYEVQSQGYFLGSRRINGCCDTRKR